MWERAERVQVLYQFQFSFRWCNPLPVVTAQTQCASGRRRRERPASGIAKEMPDAAAQGKALMDSDGGCFAAPFFAILFLAGDCVPGSHSRRYAGVDLIQTYKTRSQSGEEHLRRSAADQNHRFRDSVLEL